MLSEVEKFTFPHMFCLLSILSYEVRIIIYARAYIIMRASYDGIDNKQNMCGKVNLSTSLIVLGIDLLRGSGVARGGDGSGPHRASLLGGGGKIEAVLKVSKSIFAEESLFEWGEILRAGDKRAGVGQKKGRQKFWRVAANLRSAPGDRYSSYTPLLRGLWFWMYTV